MAEYTPRKITGGYFNDSTQLQAINFTSTLRIS